MFSQVSVCPQEERRCLPHCMLEYTPWDQRQTSPQADTPWANTPLPGPEADTPRRDTPEQCMLGYVNKRAVRIPLECILVSSIELLLPQEHTCFTSGHILNFTVLRIIFCHRNLIGKFNSSTHITSLNRFNDINAILKQLYKIGFEINYHWLTIVGLIITEMVRTWCRL